MNLVATEFFSEQVSELDEKSKRIVKEKILLIKQNPFRYKRIYSKKFSRVHRVWVNIENRVSRLVYVVSGDTIQLMCLIDRSKDYKDFEKFLKKLT
jgi:Txe/YoeB family toxin of Txe-Axe toxin-antitoxin module